MPLTGKIGAQDSLLGNIQLGAGGFATNSVSHSVDSLKSTTVPNVKFTSIDSLLQGTVVHQVSTAIDAYTPIVNAPIIRLDELENATHASSVILQGQVIMFLSNNSVAPGVVSTIPKTKDRHLSVINDGVYDPSMKFAITDSGCHYDEGWRLIPSGPSTNWMQYPWISEHISNNNGAFQPPVTILNEYPKHVTTNKIVVVSEPFGPGESGKIIDMNIFIKTSGDWQRIAHNFKPDTHVAELYLNDDVGVLWSPGVDRKHSVTISAIKLEVNKITTNNTPRHLHLYEFDAAYETDISDDLISFSVDRHRDLSDTDLSIIGHSVAATCTLILENFDNKFNNKSFQSPFQDMLSINTKFKVALGVLIKDNDYEMVKMGTFFADDWSISDDTTETTVTCRDFSKYLQDRQFEQVMYQGKLIQDVVSDIVERSGVTDYSIDLSALTERDLAIGSTTDKLGPEDLKEIKRENIIWNNESSAWEFLQNIALCDLGAFYFDEDGKFNYVTKEVFSHPPEQDKRMISDSNQIISATRKTELGANAITFNYTVPELSDTTVGLWEAESPQILSSTALASKISEEDTSIPVGDISDWQTTGYFKVDDEYILYNDRTDISFEDCERGQLGSKAVSHTPDNDLKWKATAHRWEVEGGALRVTGNLPIWGFAKSSETVKNNYSYRGRFNTATRPYKVALCFRMKNLNTFYYCLINMIDEATIGTSTKKDYYELIRSRDGNEKVLMKSNKGAGTIAKEWHSFQIDVNEQTFTASIDGTEVIKFTDNDKDAIEKGDFSVGLGAYGAGPTYFDDIVVVANDETKGGEHVVFNDSFGRPIYEVRKYEAEYNVFPAQGINYFMTETELAQVIKFDPLPFKTEAYVQNLQDGFTIIEGPRPEAKLEGLSEFFIMYGYGVTQTTNSDLTKEHDAAIRRYGRKEANITLPWVQSRTHAKALLDYLVDLYQEPISFIDVNVYCLPQVHLDDMIRVNYDRLGIGDDRFHLVSNNMTFDGSWNQTLTLRSEAVGALSDEFGGGDKHIVCPTQQPPESFYTTGHSNFVPDFSYRGYTERGYDLDRTGDFFSPIISSDGTHIPALLFRPSHQDSKWENKGIQAPSNLFIRNHGDTWVLKPDDDYAANGTFPAIVYAHGGYLDDPKHVTAYNDLLFLQKMVRMGYVVLMLFYRGTGGFGNIFLNEADYFHKEVDDLKAGAEWLKDQSFIQPNHVGLFGIDRGGIDGLVAAHKYPSEFKCVAAFSASPNIACDIRGWPVNQDTRQILHNMYNAFDGSPEANPDEWFDNSPLYQAGAITSPIFMANGAQDEVYSIRNVYDFSKQMDKNNKDLTAIAYKDRGHHLTKDDNDGHADQEFASDQWIRLMKWLGSNI